MVAMRKWSILALAAGFLLPAAMYALLPPAIALFVSLVTIVGGSMCVGRRARVQKRPAQ
jgi:hypothetical protein